MKERAKKFRQKLAGMHFQGMKAYTLKLDRMIALVDHLDGFRDCRQCALLMDETGRLVSEADTQNEYDAFETAYLGLYGRILNHLKETHGLMMPGHFRNLYALVMMIAGALAGALLIYMGRFSGLGNWSYETGILLGWVAGLLTGMITGHKKDKILKMNNRILFD